MYTTILYLSILLNQRCYLHLLNTWVTHKGLGLK